MTDYPLSLREHPLIQKRKGALEYESFCRLLKDRGIVAVVDATHPYTTLIGLLSRNVAAGFNLPYFRFLRPETTMPQKGARFAKDHEEAARIACEWRVPLLLTIGSKNLGVYVQKAEEAKVPLIVRVLKRPESIQACRDLGVPAFRIIEGQGPFTVDENIAHIRRFNIGVLVTKDSGHAGGVLEKFEAAQQTQCRVVVATRPQKPSAAVFGDVESLVTEVNLVLSQACKAG
jgi:precorrin-6A/cobalt-precorrin-6A reductase